jgi:hypothetical protein
MALVIMRTKVETKPGGWSRTVPVEVKLVAPKRWGMFTAAGDASLRKKAEACLTRVEKLVEKADGYPSREDVQAALVAFVTAWLKMANGVKYKEAGDTDVREQVAGFHDDVWLAAIGDDGTGSDPDDEEDDFDDELGWENWDRTVARAYEKLKK